MCVVGVPLRKGVEEITVKVVKGFSFAALLISLSAPLIGAQTYHKGSVQKIIIDGENYGGCMVGITPTMPSNLNCRLDFVSLDCDGESVNTKAHARSMLEMAQFAVALEKPVRFRVSDRQTVNGFCIADYIRVDL